MATVTTSSGPSLRARPAITGKYRSHIPIANVDVGPLGCASVEREHVNMALHPRRPPLRHSPVLFNSIMTSTAHLVYIAF